MRGAEPVHQRDEAGEARGDGGAVVDAHRPLRRHAQHQERHGDAMIEPRGDRGAAARAALVPSTMSVSPSIATRGAARGQPVGDGAEAVAFLDAQLGEAAHHRAALGEGGGHREDRIFVDHARRALGRHLDAFQAARAHDADRRPARRLRCARWRTRCRRPSRSSVSKSPARSGLMPTPSIAISEPGSSSAATAGKAAEEGSPGTTRSAASSSGSPVRRMRRPPSSVASTADARRRNGAACARCGRGVGSGSIDAGLARRVRARPAAPPTSPAPRAPAGVGDRHRRRGADDAPAAGGRRRARRCARPCARAARSRAPSAGGAARRRR